MEELTFNSDWFGMGEEDDMLRNFTKVMVESSIFREGWG